jgi:hypothetical protein
VLAHQGGWDEILFVAVPIALLALVLWLANRRATRAAPRPDPAPPADPDTEPVD